MSFPGDAWRDDTSASPGSSDASSRVRGVCIPDGGAQEPTADRRFRVGETFNGELGWSFNDIDLPEGAFTTDLGFLRLSYSLTTLINLQALIQYNGRDDVWAANLRFGWLRTANSGLYVVYNENQDIHRDELGWTGRDRSVIVRHTYLFDVPK